MRPRSSSSVYTAFASMPSASAAPSSSPRPRTSITPSSLEQRVGQPPALPLGDRRARRCDASRRSSAHDRRRRDRRARVGAAVIARLEHGGDVGARPARSDRHPVAHRLGQRDHVGAHAGVLEAEPATGAPEAGLDLVDHHQRADLVAQLADRRAGTPSSPGGRRPRPGSARSAPPRPNRRRLPASRRGRPTRRGGSLPASAGTARAWSAARSPRASPACARGSCRAR